jgi:hypothetical protein
MSLPFAHSRFNFTTTTNTNAHSKYDTFGYLDTEQFEREVSTALQNRCLSCSVIVTVTLRQTVNRPVYLGVRLPSGSYNQFFPVLTLIMFRPLRVCWCGTPSLTRSWVCSFQFLLGIASAAFLRFESHGTHEHILLSLFLRLPQPGGPGSCIYFPQEQGSPVLPPGIGCSVIR